MQSPVGVGMSFLVGLLLAAFAFRVGRSQIDIGSCSAEAIFCLADEDCSVCAGQLQELQDAGTITADADCLAFFADVCSAVDETCDVTNEFLVNLAACLAEDQLGCTGFTSTTCAEATAMTPAPSATPAPSTLASVSLAPSVAPTMMDREVTTGAPTMAPTMLPTMPPTRTTGAPTMAPTATTGTPTITPGSTMGPTAAPSVSESMAGPTAEGTGTPAPMLGDTESGSNAGARLSSAATATTTLVGLTLVVGLLVVPSRVL